jgi:hypothetical protein
MRGFEIKELRWREVDKIGRWHTVKKSKTEQAERVMSLNPNARGGNPRVLSAGQLLLEIPSGILPLKPLN